MGNLKHTGISQGYRPLLKIFTSTGMVSGGSRIFAIKDVVMPPSSTEEAVYSFQRESGARFFSGNVVKSDIAVGEFWCIPFKGIMVILSCRWNPTTQTNRCTCIERRLQPCADVEPPHCGYAHRNEL